MVYIEDLSSVLSVLEYYKLKRKHKYNFRNFRWILQFIIALIRLSNLTKLTFQMEWFWQEELQNNNTSCNHPSTPRQLFAYFEQKRDLPKIKRALIHETTNRSMQLCQIEYIYIFHQQHYLHHLEMYMDAFFGRRVQLDCMELFRALHRTARLEMKFLK